MTTRPQTMPQQTKKPGFNLATFLKKLTLDPMVITAPPMPPPHAQRGVTPMKMRPGGIRFLKEVRIMESFEKDAKVYFERKVHVNDVALRSVLPDTQEPTKSEGTKTPPYHFSSRNDVQRAVQQGPLQVACALAKIISRAPTVEGRVFDTVSPTASERQDPIARAIEPLYVRHTAETDTSCHYGPVKCIVLAVAPWEFSRKDFQDFVNPQQWPDEEAINDRFDNFSTNAHSMWAYIHDLCVIHKCTSFVLTSYEMWTFGVFSPFYTLGSVSLVFPWNWSAYFAKCSILEMVIYWILSAFDQKNISADTRVEAEENNAQEYKFMNETCCSVGDVLGADPDAVLALYHAT